MSAIIKVDPSFKAPKSEEIVHKWLLNDKHVSVIRNQNQLTLLAIDLLNQSVTKTPIPLSEDDTLRKLQLRDAPAHFRNCYIEDGEVSTPTLFDEVVEWPFPLQVSNLQYSELKLVSRKQQLCWLLFNRMTKTSSWMNIDPNTPRLKEYLSKAKTLPEQELWRLQSSLQVKAICINDRIQVVVDITSDLLKHNSEFDTKVQLTETVWAVTLFSGGPCSHICDEESKLKSLDTDLRFGHAMIAYEGVRNGIKFTEYVHFTKNEKVKFIKDRSCSVRLKSPTWVRSAQVVNDMLDQIKKDKDRQIKFSFLGGHKPYTYNCLTWALQYLSFARISLLKSLNVAPEFFIKSTTWETNILLTEITSRILAEYNIETLCSSIDSNPNQVRRWYKKVSDQIDPEKDASQFVRKMLQFYEEAKEEEEKTKYFSALAISNRFSIGTMPAVIPLHQHAAMNAGLFSAIDWLVTNISQWRKKGR